MKIAILLSLGLVSGLFGSLSLAGTCVSHDGSGVYDNYCAQRTNQGQNYCEATRICDWVNENTRPREGSCYSRTGNPSDDSNCASRARIDRPYCEAGGTCIWSPR